MNSRQSHKPLGKRKKGSLRFAEGKRRSTVGQTSRQTKQFSSGIMGKYGFDRNNYLGMFALIFKGKGLLTDKELASIKNPSDRAWVLQLQLQLQNLKHPESAPLITKQQMIGQLQQLITQSGYRLPKQVIMNESSTQEERNSADQVTAVADQSTKKSGRKSKKDRKLATKHLPVQETVHAVKKNEVKSEEARINAINKRNSNSPIMGRSMRQLVASIGMIAHSTGSKKIQPNSNVNEVKQAHHTTNIQQKTLHLLYKQALRDGHERRSSRSSEDNGRASVQANHTHVAQHVNAIRSTSEWLEQFQAGELSADHQQDSTVGTLSSVESILQTQPSFMHVAKLILRDVTQTPMNYRGTSQSSSLGITNKEIRRSNLIAKEDGYKQSLKLGEGPFSPEATPSAVRFIRSVLLKHADAQGIQTSQQPSDEAPDRESKRVNRSNVSVAKGFLASSQQPMAINAASLTSKLPRSMHAAAARSNTTDRSQVWNTDSGMTPVWRKASEQAEHIQEQRTNFNKLEDQLAEAANDIRRMQHRDELGLQAAETGQDQVIALQQRQGQASSSQVVEQQQGQQLDERHGRERSKSNPARQDFSKVRDQDDHVQEKSSEQAAEANLEQAGKEKRERPRKQITSNDQPDSSTHVEKLSQRETTRGTDQEAVASSRVTALTPLPNKVYRKPVAKENERSAFAKIQSNENWLQQLVTLQRQPSSTDSSVRSTNRVSKNIFQASFSGGPVINALNVHAKPDLSAEVRAKTISKPSDYKWNGSERTALSSNRSAGIAQKVNRAAPFKQTDTDLRSTETPRKQEDHSRTQQIIQQARLENQVPVNGSKLPSGQLAFDIAAKIAKASLRTLSPSTTKTIGSVVQEGGRVLRSPIVPSEANNKHLAGLPEASASDFTLGATRQALAAEIAAKVVQNTMTYERPSTSMTEGPLVLQRRLQKESNLLDSGTAVGDRQRQIPITQATESGLHSQLGSRVIAAGVGGNTSARTSTRSSAQGNNNELLVAGKMEGRSPIDMIRRAGSPSRMDRVREQQGTIQRKIDLGQFVSRQADLRISSQTKESIGEPSTRNLSRRGTWAREQLTLRAGRVENGTLSRRSNAIDSTEQTQLVSETEQGRQAIPRSEMETGQQVNRAEEPEHAQRSSNQVSEIMMSEIKQEESSLVIDKPQTRIKGDEHEQEVLPIRQRVRGTLVQPSSRVEDGIRSRTRRDSNNQLVRRLSRAEPELLVQRLSGSENGIQARRIKGVDSAQSLGSAGGFERSQLVQRSANKDNGVQAGRIHSADQARSLGTTNGSEQGNFVQRSSGTESGSITNQGINEETARQMGQLRAATREVIVQRDVERKKNDSQRSLMEGVANSLQVRRQTSMSSNRSFIQRAVDAGQVNLIQRASESRIRQLINRATSADVREGAPESNEAQAVAKRRSVNWTGAQAEHFRRQARVDDREPEREAHGSENRLDSAEQTIRAMVSAQVEERAQALEPAAASRAAEVVPGARSARAPRARQNASMTPRVMPLLASPAGALRAAPAGMAATSPAAAERQLPARGTGSLTLAAASGRAAAPTAGVQRTASLTNSSSQGWAAAALTKPLPTQVQRQARAGAMPSSADHRNGAPNIGVPQLSRTQPPSIGASHQGAPAMSTPLQSRTQAAIGAPMQPLVQTARQEHLAAPVAMLEHKQAPASLLSDAPLEMDWLRTKASADQEVTPAAPVEQAPPELSEEQLQELIKQLPQLDIAKIADKVYREIEKKMKFERQRRGV